MPEYLSPGVYVEEIDAGPKPIEGVSTSTAGAVGVTSRGPTRGKPVLVTSFADFERTFGSFLPLPQESLVNQWALNDAEGGRYWLFPLAVKGFFDNGGQRLYVKRVFSSTAVASSAGVGGGLVAELAADARPTDTAIRLRHLFNVTVNTQIRLFADADPNPVANPNNPFTVSAIDARTNRVELNQAVGVELRAGRDFAEIVARTNPITLNFTAKALGVWGDDVRVRVRPMVGAALDLLPDPVTGGAPASTTLTADVPANAATGLTVAASANFNANDRVAIDGREYVVQAVPGGTQITLAAPGVFVPPGAQPTDVVARTGTTVRRLRPANAANAQTVRVRNASLLYDGALVELDNGAGAKDLLVVATGGISGDVVTFTGNVANVYHEGHKLRVVEAEVAAQYAPNGVLQTDEVFTNLRLVDDQSLNYLVRHINLRSTLIDVATGPAFSSTNIGLFPTPAGRLWQPLTNGNDNEAQLTPDDFVGVDAGSGRRTGIQALEDIDEISICLAPSVWSLTVRNALVQHCETLKDRFAIVDSRDGLSIEGIREFREPIDTKYAALYYPWIEVRDPSVRRNVWVAPSAHMAGIYARVDVERGVHKAPANEVIRGITRIAQDVTKREQDMLNPRGINALRAFPNRGNRVWGARVLTSDSAWRYIPVRRLFIFVEESIDEGTQWVVFEPNDEPLWARVRQSISNFLIGVWRSGALEGAKPDEAFFVKCDRTTMTQDDIDNGRLICLIGIAPVKPAEFVIFRIQQKTREVRVA
jgi:phage tail sheath protein FI